MFHFGFLYRLEMYIMHSLSKMDYCVLTLYTSRRVYAQLNQGKTLMTSPPSPPPPSSSSSSSPPQP